MTSPTDIHLIEPGGIGGVYQHTAELGRLLAQSGCSVTLHTAADHEEIDIPELTICRCVEWYRGRSPQWLRAISIVSAYIVRTLPHLWRHCRGIVWVQGLFKAPLYSATICALKPRCSRLIFSPHNTFVRSGKRWEQRVLIRSSRAASKVVVYSRWDHDRLCRWDVNSTVMPLVQLVPDVEAGTVARWRNSLDRAGRPVVLVVGQIRRDKGVEDAIRAAEILGESIQLVVVGDDRGAASTCYALAAELGIEVSWHIGYQALRDLVAQIASADVVVLPYGQASQSGILTIANAMKTPTIAYDVGGLPEQATVSVPVGHVQELASAIAKVVGGGYQVEPGRESGEHAAMVALRDLIGIPLSHLDSEQM